jgi:phospholipid/cholesterol/gamma-HCH transport system substrate-binding protein
MVDLLPAKQVSDKCFALAQTLNAKKLPMTDQLRKLLGQKVATTAPAPAPAATPAEGPTQSSDLTLGGILRGPR